MADWCQGYQGGKVVPTSCWEYEDGDQSRRVDAESTKMANTLRYVISENSKMTNLHDEVVLLYMKYLAFSNTELGNMVGICFRDVPIPIFLLILILFTGTD